MSVKTPTYSPELLELREARSSEAPTGLAAAPASVRRRRKKRRSHRRPPPHLLLAPADANLPLRPLPVLRLVPPQYVILLPVQHLYSYRRPRRKKVQRTLSLTDYGRGKGGSLVIE